jgi:DNA repair protein RecN (Recombination protein N)
LRETTQKAAADIEEISLRLAELDLLAPMPGEETELAGQRALLGSAEKALTDIAAARDGLAADALANRLAQAFRALERARERALQSGAASDSLAVLRLTDAANAVDRALVETQEAASAIDAAANEFDFEPDQLEKAEERLFALRAMARKLNLTVEDLPGARLSMAQTLRNIESADEALRLADAKAAAARSAYLAAASDLTAARIKAGQALALAVEAELAPLKLDKARFRVAVEPLAEDRCGPAGADRIEFEVMTNPGAPFGGLGVIASGGELARFALALKAALAGRMDQDQPLMIFDEVDQGVGGAVADAVGLRLRRLASSAQVLVVTHSPQVAARANAHWRVAKSGDGAAVSTSLDILNPTDREEELARMLSGAAVTEAARAAARALMG